MSELRGSAARLTNATVHAPGRPAALLNDVSMHVGPGQRMLVIGPSGSGKSTLLQALTGVIPFSQNLALEGRVYLGDTDVTDLPVVERSRRVGVVTQDPSSSVCLARVDQEVALPLENHAVSRDEISARIDEALARADAGGLRERATAGLSGGEVQRVALAAALAARPDMLLLDEPTSMLDPAGVQAVRDAINTAVSDGQTAVVMVEHRLDELAGSEGARGLPERAMILDDAGRVVASGPTQTVLAENAVRLHDAGCWLPLETELLAVTGHSGGLWSPSVQTWLRQQASGESQNQAHGGALLSARSLFVGHRPAAPRKSGRWSRPGVAAILADVDLTVHAGEVIALLGANGSGKSSLLLTLAGLLPAISGDVEGPRPSMVFQHPELQFLAHRVRDEIATGLTGDATEIAEVVDRQLRQHRLEHVADRDPYRLSGGEKRRLSLAAMLAHVDRPVLLADEPAFGLDRRDTVALAGVFREEAARGRSILFSSHDMRFVATVADRVVVLADGEVVADGPSTAILQNTEVLRRAGLNLPSVVAWLLAECDTAGVSRALWQLYEATADWQSRRSDATPVVVR